MKYNPEKHNRRTIRLKGYDYSQSGFYFITICCHGRELLFGDIKNGEMIWNDAGNITNECWLDIPNHFPNVVLHEFIVMPNHIHGIIEIKTKSVGAIYDTIVGANDGNDTIVGANDYSPLQCVGAENYLFPRSPSKTIGSIVRGFKIGVTKWMRQNTNVYDVWQRNYWEHIIRDDNDYERIAKYIVNNPQNWDQDQLKNIK